MLMVTFALVGRLSAQCTSAPQLSISPAVLPVGSSVTLSWTAPNCPGFAGYRVWVQPPGGSFAPVADLLSNQRSYMYATSLPGSYSFYVAAAYNTCTISPPPGGCGSSSPSNTVTATAQVSQPCSYLLSSARFDAPAGGMSATVSVTSGSGCPWTAFSRSPFIAVSSGTSGSGSGVVTFVVNANDGPARSGSMTIAGQDVAVSQAAMACSFTLAPMSLDMSPSSGVGEFAVSTAAACTWSAATESTFVVLFPDSKGTGSGIVRFFVLPNPGAARQAAITVGTQTFTVRQARTESSGTRRRAAGRR